jgi:predicted DNA-binding protein (MmcQ/YjbR family)
MNIEQVRDYCLSKRNTTESFPFDETTLVFKVENRMYALLSLDTDKSMNLKCDPERAIDLRERFDFIKPGYHMNKQHWNTIEIASCPDDLLLELIDHSYYLILSKMPKKIRANYSELFA